MADIGKAVERYLNCADKVIEVTRNSSLAEYETRKNAVISFNDSSRKLRALWARQESQLDGTSDSAGKAACANAWISAHVERKLYIQMEMMLMVVRDQAAVATSPTGTISSWCRCAGKHHRTAPPYLHLDHEAVLMRCTHPWIFQRRTTVCVAHARRPHVKFRCALVCGRANHNA